MADPKLQNRTRVGFTLVELLTVIAIIGILAALLLPAVSAAREAARRGQCMNNLKQIGIAVLAHETAQGFFPSGGWSKEWTADPNRGFGKRQPGSWQFDVLPFIEDAELHDLGRGEELGSAAFQKASEQLHRTAPRVFYCPSRRPAEAYPGRWVRCYNAPSIPGLAKLAKSDYAANGGDGVISSGDPPFMRFPRSYAEADSPGFPWTPTDRPGTIQFHTGVMYYRSEVQLSHIRDGVSKTYLAGEKYLNVGSYNFTDVTYGDNQSIYTGYEWDNTRLTHWDSSEPDDLYGPRQDNLNDFFWFAFGSAHRGSFYVVFCDGSVQPIHYHIDRELHRRLGNRLDGELVENEE